MSVEDIIQKSEKFLEIKKSVRKQNTFKTYRKQLNKFILFLEEKDIDVLDTDTYYSYINYLNEKGLSHNSIALATNVVKSFYDFCEADTKNISSKPFVETDIEYLTEEEINRVLSLKAPRNASETELISFTRKYLLFRIMVKTGMRISEAINLRVKDIDFDERSISIGGEHVKRSKHRTVFFDETTGELLRAYIKKRKLIYNDIVFDVTDRMARKYVKQLARRAKIKKRVTNHLLRHSFAINFLKKGGNIEHLKKLLGHSNLNTTMRYLKFTDTDLKEAYEKTMRH